MDPARQPPVRLDFGPFTIDVRAGELRRGGRRIGIQQKPLALLLLLLERSGEVVTREEAIARLWPGGVHVDYGQGLANAVQKLRRALGDLAAHPSFIETLPRRGLRSAPAAGAPGSPRRPPDGSHVWPPARVFSSCC